MPQNFSGQNLRGRSFKGQNLSGVNFASTDIRGADFTNALLIGANFKGAKAGLQQHWVVGLIVCSWLLTGLSGYFSIIVSVSIIYILEPANQENFTIGIGSLTTLVIFFTVIFRKGLVVGAVAVVVGGALAGAVVVGGAVALAGALAGAGVGAVALALTLINAYIGWRGWAGDEKYASIRSFAVAFAAIGGTSFRAADLTDANFARARLKSTDFRSAILTRTCWHDTEMLDLVRPRKTYLQNPQLRQVLVTGWGQDKNFDRHDLRGVNFQQAHLADASFRGCMKSIESNFCVSRLQKLWLESSIPLT